MTKQRTRIGLPVAFVLEPSVPDDLVPMGDGVRLYSASQKMVVNAEACFFSEIVQSDDTPQPDRPSLPPGPPTP